MSVEDLTTCSGIATACQYCGRTLPDPGDGPRECPERTEGTDDRVKYGASGDPNGI